MWRNYFSATTSEEHFFFVVFLEFKTNFNFDNESSMTRWNPAEAQRLDSEGVTV